MSVNQAPLRLMALSAIFASLLVACGREEPAPEPVLEGEAASVAAPATGLRFIATEPAPGERVAARVGQTVITVSDVTREAVAREFIIEGEPLAEESPVFQDALSELIDQRLLALEAAERGLETERDARRRLAAAEERILGNVLVETAISQSVTEEAIQRVYDEQAQLSPRVPEVRARHILVETREEADNAKRLVDEGASFIELASRISRDPATRLNGGDLGYFTQAGIVPGFAEVAFATPEGAVSEPFETEYGWHILTIVDRRTQPRASLESMRASIVRFLTLQEIDGLVSELRDSYPVVIQVGTPPGDLRTTDPSPQDTAEEAGDAGP